MINDNEEQRNMQLAYLRQPQFQRVKIESEKQRNIRL